VADKPGRFGGTPSARLVILVWYGMVWYGMVWYTVPAPCLPLGCSAKGSEGLAELLAAFGLIAQLSAQPSAQPSAHQPSAQPSQRRLHDAPLRAHAMSLLHVFWRGTPVKLCWRALGPRWRWRSGVSKRCLITACPRCGWGTRVYTPAAAHGGQTSSQVAL
jgi:hypothetical protein